MTAGAVKCSINSEATDSAEERERRRERERGREREKEGKRERERSDSLWLQNLAEESIPQVAQPSHRAPYP